MFYIDGIKGIPVNIYHYLTPVALAHWIMGDGTWVGCGVILCTDSYKLQDIVRLMNVLKIRYNIDCTLRYCKKYPRLYINSKSIPLLRSIVFPYIHSSFQYKFNLYQFIFNIYI